MRLTHLLFATLFYLSGMLIVNSVQATTRIISIGSTITEILLALDAAEQLVAVDVSSRQLLKGESLPIVGYQRQLSAEGLLALKPTHLVGSEEMGPNSVLQLLRSAGVNVQQFNEKQVTEKHLSVDQFSTTFDAEYAWLNQLCQRIDQLAQLTQRQQQAVEIKAQVQTRWQQLTQQRSGKRRKVIFMLLQQGRPIAVAGQQTTVDKIIRLAGLDNPLAHYGKNYPTVAIDAILQVQPDVILLAERSFKQLGGISGLLAQHPLLAETPAVKQRQVISVPSYALQGGFGLSSLALAEQLQQTLTLSTVH
ncbi:heme/hemin ABC transporter substrate-binding protein [Serratia microhaemolytica]|uniref:heme/hemin ABC transporter substrate-binding protein n=1 Tax=Serratia microhaemolytica TaxID=2675110 RepID=UPI000FDF644B|nr:ABC transporter substrate-binding protein [Serratia microhaemolytica]